MGNRGKFNSKFGFIAAAAGTAVGLGNIWRFPFEVANGGGAVFILIYLGFCFLICYPLMVTEIAIGRKTERDASGAFTKLGFSKWRFLGKMGIAASVIGLSLYSVIAAWAFGYFIEMLLGNFSIGSNFDSYIKDIFKIGLYSLIFLSVTVFIVSKGVSGGIEKASKILMPSLLLMIIILGSYAMTLPNGIKGISFYLIPDFSKINLPVIYGALAQAFFSLSLGMGAHITFGSYALKEDNILASASLITLSDVVVAFLAGFMMFPFVAYLNNGDVAGVVGGPGLIFETLPSVFESLGPVAGIIVGSFFFLLLSFAALTSAVALLEVPVAFMIDEYKIVRKRATWSVAIFIFTLSIPSLLGNGYSDFFTNFIQYGSMEIKTNFLTFILHINDAIMLSGGFLISIFGAYIWHKKKLNEELSVGFPGYKDSMLEKFIGLAISYLCPATTGLIFILTVLDRYFGVVIL